MTSSTLSHVLVVDDDPRNASLLCHILRSVGLKTAVATDGPTCLREVRADTPDLVLLDVMMPGMDGYEVCRRLKADAGTRQVPVILVTALSSIQDRVRGLDAGADDFVSKPIHRLDMLARVRTQLRMKSLLDEVTESRDSLARQNDQLTQLENLRRDLFHMVVHDLKSPLAALELSVDLLRDQESARRNGLGETTIHNIADCSRQLGSLVRNILDVARLEESGIELHSAHFDFAGLSEASLRFFQVIARNERKRIVVRSSPGAARAYGDLDVLGRVLENFVSNALRLSPEGSEIELSAEPADDGATCITVADRGPGVPESERLTIFDKFRSGGTTSGHNHGLGLTYCKLAVEAHGGRIWVEPRPGGGSLFRFTLPAAPAQAPAGCEALPELAHV
jgi:signal transduction histidine kinase